jgi:hypothetical protein
VRRPRRARTTLLGPTARVTPRRERSCPG